MDAKKKSLRASEQDPVARQTFRDQQPLIDAADLVVLDECGSNLNLTPRYGRSPRGTPAYGHVPRNTPPNTTLLAALTLTGIGPSLLVSGATDRAVFETYVAQVLAPALRPGQIVVLDNLSAHHSPRVAALIAARQCRVWFLPSYSPDLSPIELAFAKLKQAWRTANARTTEALYATIAASLATITAADAAGFFQHCGYRIATAMAQSL